MEQAYASPSLLLNELKTMDKMLSFEKQFLAKNNKTQSPIKLVASSFFGCSDGL